MVPTAHAAPMGLTAVTAVGLPEPRGQMALAAEMAQQAQMADWLGMVRREAQAVMDWTGGMVTQVRTDKLAREAEMVARAPPGLLAAQEAREQMVLQGLLLAAERMAPQVLRVGTAPAAAMVHAAKTAKPAPEAQMEFVDRMVPTEKQVATAVLEEPVPRSETMQC